MEFSVSVNEICYFTRINVRLFFFKFLAEMENPGSSNLLKGKMPGDVIQIDTDEETINTTIEPDEVDSTDSAQNLDEMDNQSENGK